MAWGRSGQRSLNHPGFPPPRLTPHLLQSAAMLLSTLRIPQLSRSNTRLITGTALILLLAASRILRLGELQMHSDEVWSIWQTFGTPAQILAWTPFDWPPAYFLLLGTWKGLVGIHPIALRLLSVSLFLLGSAALFRFFYRVRGLKAAVLVVLAFAALGFTIRISTEVRGYMLMYALYLFALWFTERYFSRPTFWRGLVLALCMVGMFYAYLPGVLGYLMLGMYTLVVYPRRIWRWWLPGLIAGLLALPLVGLRITQARDRVGLFRGLDNFFASISDYFTRFTVYQSPNYPLEIWLLLVIAATLVIVIFWRRANQRRTWAFFAWAFLMPVLMWLADPITDLFFQHYSMALMLSIGVWVGWGLAYLRRWAFAAALVVLVGLNVYPFTTQYVLQFYEPFDDNMKWLSQHIHEGDVLLIDPLCLEACEVYDDMKWDYYTQLYFPNGGLRFVDQPGNHRRIWYITNELNTDPAMKAAVGQSRIAGEFVGPAGFFWRLYEAPPDTQGIRFTNGMRFHGADMIERDHAGYETGPLFIRREGETITLRLWWSVDEPIERDYSVGVYVLDEQDMVIAQVDSPPQVIDPIYPYTNTAPPETSQWQPGQFYIEERQISLPYPLVSGRYPIVLALYDWQTPEERVRAPGVDESGLLPLKTLTISSW